MDVPIDCPRGRVDCKALSNLISDDKTSFFCCGENNGEGVPIAQDIYTVCFKGDYRDDRNHYDKRDLVHNGSVLIQALAVIEKPHNRENDWSPWGPKKNG